MGMTIKDLIEELTEIMSEEGPDMEVVARNQETDEPYTPVLAWGPDKDGVRRLSIA